MKTNLSNKRFKKQAGVTLMELIAGLSVMAVVVVGSLSLYNSATSSQQTTQLTQDTSAVRAAVKQMWQGQGSFGANLNDVLVTARKIPTTIRVNTGTTPDTLTHAANGTMNITSSVTTFDVALTNIDESLCIPLLTGAQGWTSVTVAGSAAITTFPIAPATASTACATGTVVTFRGN
jgi:type II secretory pathway pseudopilin PulG